MGKTLKTTVIVPAPKQPKDLRDWFAGQALAGMLSDPHLPIEDTDSVAKHCFVIADAMLKARG